MIRTLPLELGHKNFQENEIVYCDARQYLKSGVLERLAGYSHLAGLAVDKQLMKRAFDQVEGIIFESEM